MFLYVSICFYDFYVVFGVTRQTFQPTHQPKPHLLQNLCADQHSEPVHQEKPVDSDRLRTATRHVMGEADGTLSMNLGLGHDYILKKNYPGCLIADDMLANAWNWEKKSEYMIVRKFGWPQEPWTLRIWRYDWVIRRSPKDAKFANESRPIYPIKLQINLPKRD